jgi:hypothetical protein
MILKPGQLPDCEQAGISLGWRNILIMLKMADLLLTALRRSLECVFVAL